MNSEEFSNGPAFLLQIASHLTKIDSEDPQVHQIQDDVQSILETLQQDKITTKQQISIKLSDINQQLCELFELKEQRFLCNYGCSLVKSNLIIKGFVLMTESHLCFMAHFQKEPIVKEGYLQKRKRKVYSSQWITLKGDILRFHSSSKDVYSPLGSITLKECRGVQLQSHNVNGFKVIANNKKYYFIADTPESKDEWINAIESAIFGARQGEILKVVLPYTEIAKVDFVFNSWLGDSLIISTGTLPSSDIKLKKGHSYTHSTSTSPVTKDVHSEDYCFSYFRNCREVFDKLEELKKSIHYPEHLEHEETSSSPRKSGMLSNLAIKVQQIELSPRSYSGETDANMVQKQFSGLYPDNVNLIYHTLGYQLDSAIPRLGRIYVTSQHILFYSSVIGIRKRSIIPIRDILLLERFDNKLGFWYGLYVVMKHGETWFEFRTFAGREKCISVLEEIIVATKAPQEHDEYEYASSVEEDNDNSSVEIEDLSRRTRLHTQNVHLLKMLDDIHRLDSQFIGASTEFQQEEQHNQSLQPVFDSVVQMPQYTVTEQLNISCATVGTRGDVQPFIALCKRLQDKGHRCTIATHAEYQDWIESHGISFKPISGNPSDLMQLCVDNGMFSISFFMEAASKFKVWFSDLLESAWVAMQGADVIIESPVSMAGYHIAEKLQVPYFSVFTMPWTRTQDFPHPFAISDTNLGIGYNLMTWVMMENVLWKGMQNLMNKFRKNKLNLPPLSSGSWLEEQKVPFLYSFSNEVVRPPKDWSAWVQITGYWFLDQPDKKWVCPEALHKFLNPGSKDKRPIVYIGFGSIIVKDPEQLTRVVLEAVKKAGVRAIISKGWSARAVDKESHTKEEGEFKSDSTVYNLTQAPHDWLFPLMDAVVHHGGAGTTAAGLRAGKPTIIKPFFGDQYFWAQQLGSLGVGLTLKKFDADLLKDLLVQVTTDEKIKAKAANLGEKIRLQDGIGVAVDAILKQVPVQRNNLQTKRLIGQQRKVNPVTSALNQGLNVLNTTLSTVWKGSENSTSAEQSSRRKSVLDSMMFNGGQQPSKQNSMPAMRLKLPKLKRQTSKGQQTLASKIEIDGYVSDTSVDYGRLAEVKKPNKLRRKQRPVPKGRPSKDEHPPNENNYGQTWMSWKSLGALAKRSSEVSPDSPQPPDPS